MYRRARKGETPDGSPFVPTYKGPPLAVQQPVLVRTDHGLDFSRATSSSGSRRPAGSTWLDGVALHEYTGRRTRPAPSALPVSPLQKSLSATPTKYRAVVHKQSHAAPPLFAADDNRAALVEAAEKVDAELARVADRMVEVLAVLRSKLSDKQYAVLRRSMDQRDEEIQFLLRKSADDGTTAHLYSYMLSGQMPPLLSNPPASLIPPRTSTTAAGSPSLHSPSKMVAAAAPARSPTTVDQESQDVPPESRLRSARPQLAPLHSASLAALQHSEAGSLPGTPMAAPPSPPSPGPRRVKLSFDLIRRSESDSESDLDDHDDSWKVDGMELPEGRYWDSDESEAEDPAPGAGDEQPATPSGGDPALGDQAAALGSQGRLPVAEDETRMADAGAEGDEQYDDGRESGDELGGDDDPLDEPSAVQVDGDEAADAATTMALDEASKGSEGGSMGSIGSTRSAAEAMLGMPRATVDELAEFLEEATSNGPARVSSATIEVLQGLLQSKEETENRRTRVHELIRNTLQARKALMTSMQKEVLPLFFTSWRQHVVDRQAFYRTCFWPFHVWLRRTRARRPLRKKALALRDVFNTFMLIRIFRAWVKSFRKRRSARQMRSVKDRALLTEVMRAWLAYARPRARLRRIINSRRYRQLQSKAQLSVYFGVLHCYASYKATVRRRSLQAHERALPPLTRKPAPPCCSHFHAKYVIKDAQERKIVRFRREQLCPLILREWHKVWLLMMRMRFGEHRYRTRMLRRHLGAWHKIAVWLRQERMRRRLEEEQLRQRQLEEERRRRAQIRSMDLSQLTTNTDILQKKTNDLATRRVTEVLRTDEIRTEVNGRWDVINHFLQDRDVGADERIEEEAKQSAVQLMELRRTTALLFVRKTTAFLDGLEDHRRRFWQRRCFNSLAASIRWRRAVRHANRAYLWRLLSHAHRMRRGYKAAKLYSFKLLQHRVIQAWKQYTHDVRELRSRGLRQEIIRRRYLARLFSNHLHSASGSGEDFKSCFLRWLEFSQMRVVRDKVARLMAAKRLWKLMHKCFLGLRYGVRGSREASGPTAMELHLIKDLSLWKELFLRHKLYSETQRVRRRKFASRVGRQVMGRSLLDDRMEVFREQVLVRIRLEQNLLLLLWQQNEDYDLSPDDTPAPPAQAAMLRGTTGTEVLRLRKVELMMLLDHCRDFGQRISRSSLARSRGFRPLDSPPIASRLTMWLFEAKCLQLVKTPSLQDENDGRASLPEDKLYWAHLRDLAELTRHEDYPSNVVRPTLNL